MQEHDANVPVTDLVAPEAESVASHDMPISNAPLTKQRLNDMQKQFLEMLSTGLEQRFCLHNLNIDSRTYHSWKQNEVFLSFERDIELNVAIGGPKLVQEIMHSSGPTVARSVVTRALDPKDRQSQRAAETVLEAIGIIGKSSSGVNVQVNLGTGAQAWLSTQAIDTDAGHNVS